MKLVGVLGVGLIAAAGCCCCGDPRGLLDRARALVAGGDTPAEVAAPVEAPAPEKAPAPPELSVGIPARAEEKPAPPGTWMRYIAPISVEKARQFHNKWLREHGWQIQVDSQTANGWVLEAVKDSTRLSIDLRPVPHTGDTAEIERVNAVLKLL